MSDQLLQQMHEEYQSMKLSEMVGGESKYLKAADLPQGKELPLTIDRIVIEQVEQQDGPAQEKAVCYFRGKEKGLILNVTNANRLVDAFGEDSNDSEGKKVILYRDITEFKGTSVPCLRLRVPADNVDPEDIPF